MTGLIQLGLIGHPVSHSLSPAMHTRWFAEAGLNATYTAWDCPSVDALPELLAELHANTQVLGANVTIPYKTDVIPHLAFVDPLARRIGAVNTLFRHPDYPQGWAGANTDYSGFLESLPPLTRTQLPHTIAVVLGAGGGARAIVAALLDAPVQQLIVVARRPEQANDLLAALQPQRNIATVVPWAQLAELPWQSVGLVVNTTPLGQKVTIPDVEWASVLPIPWAETMPGVFVDLVYAEVGTPLTRWAKVHGWLAIDGLPMLEVQGRLSWPYWFGDA